MRDAQDIWDKVKKQSPREQAKFRKNVFKYLELVPMMLLLREPEKEMTPQQEFAMRNWVMGVSGSQKPDFVIDDVPDEVIPALRKLLEHAHQTNATTAS